MEQAPQRAVVLLWLSQQFKYPSLFCLEVFEEEKEASPALQLYA
jgi:hypothetical protein